MFEHVALWSNILIEVVKFLDYKSLTKFRQACKYFKYFIDDIYSGWLSKKSIQYIVANNQIYGLKWFKNQMDSVYLEAFCRNQLVVLNYIYKYAKWIPLEPEILYIETCIRSGRISMLRWIKIHFELSKIKIIRHLIISCSDLSNIKKLYGHPYTRRFFSRDIILFLINESAAKCADLELLKWLKQNSLLKSLAVTMGALVANSPVVVEEFGDISLYDFSIMSNIINSQPLNPTIEFYLRNHELLSHISHLLWQSGRINNPVMLPIVMDIIRRRIPNEYVKNVIEAFKIEQYYNSANYLMNLV
jgi:hypothetical protein